MSSNVRVGPYTIIHAGVEIGSETEIGSHCELGVSTNLTTKQKLVIGESSHIRSHNVFYIGSFFGANMVTGHHVTVREDTHAGCNLQIGTKGDIQGHCSFGDYVKTHSNVHIGQNSRIGSYVWMFPDVLLTNDPNPPSETLLGPIVGDYAIIASKATLLPGVHLGRECVIGAHSLVGIDVPDGKLAIGSPAKIIGPASILRMQGDPSKKAYPWKDRYTLPYPDDVVRQWMADD